MPFDALKDLSQNQKNAASCLQNAVVTAGAGSGKTRVLAARFVYLVTQQKIPVERILTLTFTKKAVTEMEMRIYSELKKAAVTEQKASEAVANFHLAHISTIDSYCTGIAKYAARFYGISPDFTVDPSGVRAQIRSGVLAFLMQNRANETVKYLLGTRHIQEITDALELLFTDYSTLSNPIDFIKQAHIQHTVLKTEFEKRAKILFDELETVKNYFYALNSEFRNESEKKCHQSLSLFFAQNYQTHISVDSNRIIQMCTLFYQICTVKFSYIKNQDYLDIKSHIDSIDSMYKDFAALANSIIQFDSHIPFYDLLNDFQKQIILQKRMSGKLTFNDVSALALNALTLLPQLRTQEKNAFDAIMIDEFQDNNSVQRDLLFLLAEKKDVFTHGIPQANALCEDKLFFVGDEKQSIYKFRGADVSVFRRLTYDLGRQINLDTNYRSESSLISAFNVLFGNQYNKGIFLSDQQEHLPDYEASYTNVKSNHSETQNSIETQEPPKEKKSVFVFTYEYEEKKQDAELEAFFTAQKIMELVQNKQADFADCAILLRSYSNQQLFESQFRKLSIPYTTETIAGFFNDAPVNDMYNILRFVVYPKDMVTYAAVLVSPFVSLSKAAMVLCLEDEPFSSNTLLKLREISQNEAEKFEKAQLLIKKINILRNNFSLCELVTFLWYQTGYRYETVWQKNLQLYAELFDYFFELAKKADEEQIPLGAFVDRIEQLKQQNERIGDMSLPVENITGVRIMSIHKSKGLEFPIVFVPNCAKEGQQVKNTDIFYYENTYGFSLNLAKHAQIPAKVNPNNYFFNIQKELELKKNTAELRRLLYVALTRAEKQVYIIGSTKEIKSKEEKEPKTFFDLLLPVLEQKEVSKFVSIETIDKQILKKSTVFYAENKQEQKQNALRFYTDTPLLNVKEPQIQSISVTSTEYQKLIDVKTTLQNRNTNSKINSPHTDYTYIDEIVQKNGAFTYADFGIITHAHLEALLKNQAVSIPPRIHAVLTQNQYNKLASIAQHMANNFIISELGMYAQKSVWQKSEFAFTAKTQTQQVRKGFVFAKGQIDLLFEYNNILHIVDFKTDLQEDAEKHKTQLFAYTKAVKDIFNKNTKTYIYYLRSGIYTEIIF